MSNAAAMAALDAHIARVETLKELGHLAAPRVAEGVRDVLVRQIARGVDPEGKPWQLTQDGEQALKGAAKALKVVAVGSVVIAKLKGPEARHNNRKAKGGVQRQILPVSMTPAMARAIRAAVVAQFQAMVQP